MSVVKYEVAGVDLSTLFAAYTSGSKAPTTGYEYNGSDLCNIFAPYTTGTKASTTGIEVNGNDLANIFSKIGAAIPNPSTFTLYQYGSGCGGTLRCLEVDNTNYLYVGGDNLFTINGVQVTYNNANGGEGRLTGYAGTTSVSTSFAQGMVDSPYTVAVDYLNNVYTGGWFNSIGPNLNHTTGQITTTYVMIAKWNGSAWSAVNPSNGGINGHIEKIVVSKVNNSIVYTCGQFTSVYPGPITTKHFVAWTGTAWSTLSFNTGNNILKYMDTDYSGNLYVVDGSAISKYNGTAWSGLNLNNSSGTLLVTGAINGIFVDTNNDIWIIGATFNITKYVYASNYCVAITTPGFTPVSLYVDTNYVFVAQGTNLKYYNKSSGVWSSNMITSMTGAITYVVYKNNVVYIGGTFTNVNGMANNRIASFR